MRARRAAACLPCALLSLTCCSRGSDAPLASGERATAGRSAVPGVTALTDTELRNGAAMVERLVTAMGGADAIGGLRSISIVGTMTRLLPGGQETSAKVRTSVRFPDLYRQELTLPAGQVITIIGPAGGWILAGAEAPLPLSEQRRLEIENIILRNPVALLKARRSELFSAAVIEGRLRIRVGSKESTLMLDENGLIQTIEYELPGSGAVRPWVIVRYSDYRRSGGILYPFTSSAEANGAVTYRLKLDAANINSPLPDSLFVPPEVVKKN